MKHFTHIILTRFNVVTQEWGNKPNEDWLHNRIKLFEKFCFPSVINQANQNFKWLVFFDENSPTFLKDKIINKYSSYNNFTPVFIDYFDIDIITEKVTNFVNTNYVITTRLDNDDAISVDYFDYIQQQFNYEDGIVLNFNNGYILNIKTNRLYKRNHYINAFCTLYEKRENLKTVWVKDHRELNTIYKLKRIKTSPMWLQIVHGNNISNTVGNDSYRIAMPKEFCYKFILNRDICEEITQNSQSKIGVYTEYLKQLIPYFLTVFLRPYKREVQDYLYKIRGKKVKFGH